MKTTAKKRTNLNRQEVIMNNIRILSGQKIDLTERLQSINALIEIYRDQCEHTLPSGESALEDTAFASPYSQKYCSICKKVID